MLLRSKKYEKIDLTSEERHKYKLRSKRVKNSNKLVSKYLGSNSEGLVIGGQDTCKGDSGGPLWVEEDGKGLTLSFVIKNIILFSAILVGLVSRGRGCAKQNYPGVYARFVTRIFKKYN